MTFPRPLDLTRYLQWTRDMLYWFIYPLIERDFMGKDDCRAVHIPGNIVSATQGSPVTYTTATGGQSLYSAAKGAQYATRYAEGRVELEVAQETGEFTG